MKDEEHDSQSLFEGKAPSPAPQEPAPTPAPGMSIAAKIAIVAVLAVLVVAVIALKNRGSGEATPPTALHQASGIPRLIEIGSVTCIPCKMMAPILDELRREYPGTLQVDFIDVQKERDAASAFGVRVIPTQVFLDAEGRELFRHEGFYPKNEILAKWKELGVDLTPPRAVPGSPRMTDNQGKE